MLTLRVIRAHTIIICDFAFSGCKVELSLNRDNLQHAETIQTLTLVLLLEADVLKCVHDDTDVLSLWL